jgi:hypothetical protein
MDRIKHSNLIFFCFHSFQSLLNLCACLPKFLCMQMETNVYAEGAWGWIRSEGRCDLVHGGGGATDWLHLIVGCGPGCGWGFL